MVKRRKLDLVQGQNPLVSWTLLAGLASLEHPAGRKKMATVCFASLDTFEVLAPPDPRTHFRGPCTKRSSDTFEVLGQPEPQEIFWIIENLARFKFSRTSDTAKTSDTFEVLAPPD